MAALDGKQAEMWTALPGIVQSFDASKMTCSVRPAIMGLVQDAQRQSEWVEIPLLVDCPVIFPSGGGVVLTFPVAKGDECLVVFASRCIDQWWQSGEVSQQAELRMHDLSDGFVLVGARSVPKVPAGVSTSAARLRTVDNASYVEVGNDGHINLVSTVHVDVTAPTMKLTGSVTVDGPLHVTGAVTTDSTIAAAGEITAVGTQLHHHQHGGVQNGPSMTGPPSNY